MRAKVKHSLEEYLTAEAAYVAINPDDSDEVIAPIVADYLTCKTHQPPYKLAIFHDVSKRTQRNMEKFKKMKPDYVPYERYGPCPLEFDWQRKNTVGIRTLDRDRARQWTIDALLLGYEVFGYFGFHGAGPGSLAGIRKRILERRERVLPRQAGVS